MSEKELLIDYKSMKYVHSLDDLPVVGKDDCYAILVFGSIYIPGDERSRTNPGHGYPGGSEPKTDFVVFASREAWEHEIRRKMQNKYGEPREWVPIVFRRATITTNVTVL
jgi:hypothetical protein